MDKLLPLFTRLFTILLVLCVTSCLDKPTELPALPPKVISDETEKAYDNVVAERFSKASASVNAIYKVVDGQPESPLKTAVLAETKVASIVLGKPTDLDAEEALKRIQAVLGGSPALDAYKNANDEAKKLREEMKVVNQNYENERAKMKAEYDAKLAERDQQLEQEKALRRLDAEEARKDKFMYAGGILFVLGVVVSIWISKHDGILLSLGGLCLSSFGWVLGTKYFYWVLLVVALLGLIKGVIVLFFQKKIVTQNESPTNTPTN